MTKSDNRFSLGDNIAIIISIISLLGVIISTLITDRRAKKNSKLQEKWNQKNIDATVISNARIEWIQKVRNNTAELLALYFEVINTVDKEALLESTIKAREKTELLILFFGHEKHEAKHQSVDLLCPESNDNKNASIVKFLTNLSKKTYRFYESVESGELNRLKDIRLRRINEMQHHVVGQEGQGFEDENGNEIVYPDPILDKEYKESLKEVEQEISNVVKISKDIDKDLSTLRDIIRVYLKIEWNIAKKGE